MLTKTAAVAPPSPSEAIVIGAGLGGLAAAMRLGAKVAIGLSLAFAGPTE